MNIHVIWCDFSLVFWMQLNKRMWINYLHAHTHLKSGRNISPFAVTAYDVGNTLMYFQCMLWLECYHTYEMVNIQHTTYSIWTKMYIVVSVTLYYCFEVHILCEI